MSATILYLVPMSELPNRLRELRKARGWSLEKVALDAGTTIPTISDLERGNMHLTLTWMRKLAPVFGVTPADLLLGEDGALADAERELVERFRRANLAQRDQLLKMSAVIVPDPEESAAAEPARHAA